MSRTDFLAGLPVEASDLPPDLALRGLRRFGLLGRFMQSRRIPDKALPVCARMTDGSYAVVLARDKDVYVLADVDLAGAERRVPKAEFLAGFDATYLTALPDLDDLQRRHVGHVTKGHWFWGQFRTQKWLIRDIVFGTLVANLLAVAVSLFALQVYDRVIPNQSEVTLWVLVGGAAIAIVFEAMLRIARSYLIDVSGRRIELQVSSMLYERLLGMRLADRPGGPGSMAYMMREFSSVREFFTASSVGSVADIPFVVIFLALIYYIAGPVVGVVLVGMVLIVIPSLLAQRKMARLSKEMLGGSSASNRLLVESCYQHEMIKSGQAEGHFLRKWEEICALNAHKTSDQRLLAASLSFWAAGIQQITYVSAVVAGVYLVFAGSFTVGGIIAISILTGRTLAPVTQLSGVLARWQQVKTALTGLDGIAKSEQDRAIDRQFARREVFTGKIAVRDLSFAYSKDSQPILKIDKLAIAPGKTLGILGRNGSGKSTLLKMVSGLYPPSGGDVLIDDLELRQIDPADVRRNIAYLPQEVRLFQGTLRENLTLGAPNINEDAIFAALEFAGIAAQVRTNPMGLDMAITDGGEGLSVGQRQSVGLARIWLQDPRIVLMDEPTSNLDQNLEADLIAKLRLWLKDRTCVLTTHRMEILSLTDRLLVLNAGKIAMQGTRQDVIEMLKANSGKKREGLQSVKT